MYTLARNKINSNYFLYYYLFQPGNLVGLSRFNYYQIPVGEPTKSFYYDDDVNELFDFSKDVEIAFVPGNLTDSNDHFSIKNNTF